MKDFFDIAIILFITLTVFVSMMVFAGEVAVQQEAVHLRNRVIEIIEIENGYTKEAKNKVNTLVEKSKNTIIVNVNKEGALEFGEEVIIEVIIFYERRLPFNVNSKTVRYSIMGDYYNINN